MAGKIRADIIQGDTTLSLNVGETTFLTVGGPTLNVSNPLNVQSIMTVSNTSTFTRNVTMSQDLTVSGNLTVQGDTTTINVSVLVVEDRNIELANVALPSTTTANGSGISVRTGNTAAGSRDPSISWELPRQAFIFNQGIDVQQVIETANVSANTLNGVSNFDVLEGAVKFYTNNPTGNWTINLRGNSSNTFDSITQTGDSVTVTYLANNGSTPYYQTGLQVDGFTRTVRWQGGSAPGAGNASSVDVYSITLVKTASNTWTVLASQTQFA